MMTMARVAGGWGFRHVLVVASLLLIFSACDSEGTQIGAPDRHALGPADAAVTLVAFDDYQ
jgi:hypothetical protein